MLSLAFHIENDIQLFSFVKFKETTAIHRKVNLALNHELLKTKMLAEVDRSMEKPHCIRRLPGIWTR